MIPRVLQNKNICFMSKDVLVSKTPKIIDLIKFCSFLILLVPKGLSQTFSIYIYIAYSVSLKIVYCL